MKIYFLLVLLLLLLPGVTAFSCDYDAEPSIYLTSRPAAFCTSEVRNVTFCYTYLSYSGDVYGLMPAGEHIDDYGVVTGYRMVDGAVVVEFDTRNLHTGVVVNATVVCGDESVSFNMTPTLLDHEEIIDVARLAQSQEYNIVGTIFILLFTLILIIVFIKLVK